MDCLFAEVERACVRPQQKRIDFVDGSPASCQGLDAAELYGNGSAPLLNAWK
jgi:hypothetical protein